MKAGGGDGPHPASAGREPAGAGTAAAGRELLPRDGRALLHEGWLAAGQRPDLAAALDWREERIRLYGREIVVPRLIAYYGERPYRYSGVEHAARPLPPVLRELADRAGAEAGVRFDSVLCNRYRDGADSMGYHRDNEPEIDPRCIASVSLGATRRFRLRHRISRETVTVDLTDGSLLLMIDCQDAWEHAVPRTKRPVGERINLTFRILRDGPGSR